MAVPIRIAIYARKSKFTVHGESVENQIKECKAYIDYKIKRLLRDEYDDNFEIVESIYKDEGYSGKNLERPAFKQMMKDTSENPFDFIMVYRLDRISRNVADFAQLSEKMKRNNTSFVSIKEDFDTSTSMGVAMLNLTAVFAHWKEIH